MTSLRICAQREGFGLLLCIYVQGEGQRENTRDYCGATTTPTEDHFHELIVSLVWNKGVRKICTFSTRIAKLALVQQC